MHETEFAALVLVILVAGCVAANAEDIGQKLIGMELAYSSIAGKTLIYKIQEPDIKSVQKIDEKQAVWKAEIGESLKWNIYLDNNGEIVEIEQLFMT